MVSHGNLMHNLGFLCEGRGHTKIVSWLPFFHDMGLIYAILQALYGGFPCVLMAPASFLQRPFRWLHALSRHRASTAIAPNFAYNCVFKKSPRKINFSSTCRAGPWLSTRPSRSAWKRWNVFPVPLPLAVFVSML